MERTDGSEHTSHNKGQDYSGKRLSPGQRPMEQAQPPTVCSVRREAVLCAQEEQPPSGGGDIDSAPGGDPREESTVP